MPPSGADVQAGSASGRAVSKALRHAPYLMASPVTEIFLQAREPTRRLGATNASDTSGRKPMLANDAAVLAKFVFLVVGLGLTGMLAQIVMFGS